MSTAPRRTIYNPTILSDADLERSFIARQTVFEELLENISSEQPDQVPQPHLVVGIRGMGKTTLLLRLALELRRTPHNERFIPLTFPEEQYVEVDRLSKFWLNCLDALADSLEREEGKSPRVKEIDREVGRVEELTTEKEQATAAHNAFESAWKRLERRPVLFIDNFPQLLNRLRKDEYVLREAFLSIGAPLLIAASASPPDDDSDYGAAFYEHFQIRVLGPLSRKEMREVILQQAEDMGKEDITRRIQGVTGRLAALTDMTGGNPRTATLLFDLFSQGLSQDAYTDLEYLLEVVTPLYQSRLDQLSEQGQVLVGALSRHWDPTTSQMLIAQTKLPQGSMGPQLLRLEEVGVVQRVPIYPGKKQGYQIAERFMNVWFLMRFTSRRQRGHLECLVRFLEGFYSPAERTISAAQMIRGGTLSARQVPFAMALASAIKHDPGLAERLDLKAQLDLVEQMDGVRQRIAEVLDPCEISPQVYAFAELKRYLRNQENATGVEGWTDMVISSFALLPGGIGTRSEDRNSIATQKLSQKQAEDIVEALNEERANTVYIWSRYAVELLGERMQAGLLTSWDSPQEIANAVRDTSDKQTLQLIASQLTRKTKLILPEETVTSLLEVLRPEENLSWTWYFWGMSLQSDWQRYTEAEDAFRKAISIEPGNAHAWNNLGILLTIHLGRHEEAEEAFKKSISIDASLAAPWNNLGNLLTDHLGYYEEAEIAFRKAIEIYPALPSPWNNLGNLLTDYMGRYEEAEIALRKAISLDPKYAPAFSNLVFLYRDILNQPIEATWALNKIEFWEGCEDNAGLHGALFSAYSRDWEASRTQLYASHEAAMWNLPANTRDDWFRAAAVLLKLGYGPNYVESLKEWGADITMPPWFAAIDAHTKGDRRYLLNVAPEVRPVAETIYDQILIRRERLPK
ncbi:MAG: tetratricopeptide repeat protein [Armatimonas sp.]